LTDLSKLLLVITKSDFLGKVLSSALPLDKKRAQVLQGFVFRFDIFS